MNISFDLETLTEDTVNALNYYLELKSKINLVQSQERKFKNELVNVKRILSSFSKNQEKRRHINFHEIRSLSYLSIWLNDEKNKESIDELKQILFEMFNLATPFVIASLIEEKFPLEFLSFNLNTDELVSNLREIKSIVFDGKKSFRNSDLFTTFFFINLEGISDIITGRSGIC
jgi:hypothetical protein